MIAEIELKLLFLS